jgi:hypothetical protein
MYYGSGLWVRRTGYYVLYYQRCTYDGIPFNYFPYKSVNYPMNFIVSSPITKSNKRGLKQHLQNCGIGLKRKRIGLNQRSTCSHFNILIIRL